MKILAIDHLASESYNRSLYCYLSKFNNVALTVLIPENWSENYKRVKIEKKQNENYKVVVGKNFFGGRPQLLLFYGSVLRCIKEKPDIIYVNSEPENILMNQVIILSKLFSKKSKIIFVTWRNLKLTSNNYPYRLSLIHRLTEKISFKYADACRSLNEDGIKYLREAGFKKEIERISWGVNIRLFSKLHSEDIKKKLSIDGFVVGYMGRLVKEKGIDLIIKALSKLQHYNIVFLMIGNGPEKNNLIKMIDTYNIKAIILDSVSYYLAPKYMNCINVLVLPSRGSKHWREQFGRILIEAMACETIVIGSDSGEIPNVIRDSGLIFNENDENGLRKAIEKVYLSVELREELIKKGLTTVNKNYLWSKIAEKMMKLFYGQLQQGLAINK